MAKNILKERPKNQNESPAYLNDVEMEADVRSCLLSSAHETHTRKNGWDLADFQRVITQMQKAYAQHRQQQQQQQLRESRS